METEIGRDRCRGVVGSARGLTDDAEEYWWETADGRQETGGGRRETRKRGQRRPRGILGCESETRGRERHSDSRVE